MIEEVEVRVEADEWRSVVGMGIQEDWLESMVAEYVSSGGAIQYVPPGVSAEVPAPFNTVDREHTEVQRRGRMNTVRKGDEKMVAIIDKHLGQCARDELMALIKCSDSKFQRLLNVYFHDDGRADPYRTVPHDEYIERHTERFVAAIKKAQADGIVGRSNVAKAARVSYATVNKLIKRGLVNVPRVNRAGKTID